MAIKHLENMQEFNNLINKNEKTIIDFYADWCGPCKMLAPIYEELSGEVSSVYFAKVDVDNLQDIAQEYGIASIPTLLIFQGGREMNRHVGFATKDQIKELLK